MVKCISLRHEVQEATRQGTLWSRDWAHHPLPNPRKEMWVPPPMANSQLSHPSPTPSACVVV